MDVEKSIFLLVIIDLILGSDFKIINIDMGIGILKLKKDFEYRSIDGIKNKDFNDFLKYRETLPIISSEEALKII